ncbi:hypothetical protein BHYA_0038g00170 [Botrytis hyacinthi]|uniref:Uncharacterized protein n=1 Tax=Botrytis hyacinthi TaxID=278943 RepID=A0A4Z1H4Z7_9HELO|nr:hypothetical protein BHYA_0038g00170 [Botrytis hyacinthi]
MSDSDAPTNISTILDSEKPSIQDSTNISRGWTRQNLTKDPRPFIVTTFTNSQSVQKSQILYQKSCGAANWESTNTFPVSGLMNFALFLMSFVKNGVVNG